MMYQPRRVLSWVLALAAAALAGCGQKPPAVTDDEAPVIPVSQPVQRYVTDYVEYTGRTAAIHDVAIRPRVTGYLVRMPFKEGAEVKKGDLLFEIDPRPYKAALDVAEGQLRLNEARLELTQAELTRGRLAARHRGAITPEQLEKLASAVAQASAAVKASQANVEAARLDLGFTRVTAPITGQVSRYYLTVGNLATQNQTLLTTVVSHDPLAVYFDMDERTLLRLRAAVAAGKFGPISGDAGLPVYMGIEGEEGFPHKGTIDFLNNSVNPATGTISVRGIFRNPKLARGVRLLSPGLFARIRLPVSDPYQALLVADRAIGSDQGLKYLYVLDRDNKVRYRRITRGPLQDDGLRVIATGIKHDDRVVVDGLQTVQQGVKVEPERVAMPTPARSPTREPALVARGN
jgi:multidrug efflux system membrane fusion protein